VKARLDEKLLSEKREIDAIVARLGELRQVRMCVCEGTLYACVNVLSMYAVNVLYTCGGETLSTT
jgi:hypothetical protein